MGPMRTLTVAIDWILMIALAICIVILIYAFVKHNKALAKKVGIVTVVVFILLFIAGRFALTIKPWQ